jgi:hypothetical protein
MKSMGFHCMTTIVPWVMQYMLIPLKCMCVFLVLLRISIESNQTKWRVSHDLRVILLNKRRPCYQMLEREREIACERTPHSSNIQALDSSCPKVIITLSLKTLL